MKRLILPLVLAAVLPASCAGIAYAQGIAVVQETPWELNGAPCGSQAQCQQAALAAAQADRGLSQSVTGPTWIVTLPASSGSTGNSDCPNIGAMQPGDAVNSDGSPVFADPSHNPSP